MNLQGVDAEADECDLFHGRVPLKELFRLAERDSCSSVHRKAVSAGADGWKRHSFDLMFLDQNETAPVAKGKQVIFSMFAVAPDRAHGVDDPFGGKFKSAGYFCLACGASPERPALFQQPGSCRAMDGPVHAASSQQ